MMLYDFFKYFGRAAIIIGIVIGFFMSLSGIVVGVTFIASSIVTGLFFIGFGALLESLHKIQKHITGEKAPEPNVQQIKNSIPGVKD
ncbi:hypothetical protein [Paenibacillus medicaginis]|uniref:DUF2273 domain-containing protein n=1 Tax=Paenibacillus medicaginis TaxID=1470560 RepID=A0ABV5C0P2_9BACL